LPPVVESPAIESPVGLPEVPVIEIVDILPPEVELLPTEPVEPLPPPADNPQAGESPGIVVETGNESIVSIIDAINTTEWIDWPPRHGNFINWGELVGGIELIRLVDYSSTLLLGDFVAGDVPSINSTGIIEMQVQNFGFSADIATGMRFFASSTSATSETSAVVPEPNSVLLGLAAIAATAEFNRRRRKTGSSTLKQL
jgi:hypothetical protein